MAPMNNRRMTPMAEPGVLDFAPGAAAAYSLRNLSLNYIGPVVTVRRSTDNAEADFTASEVSDGTLAAWCGAGDGFVKQWWSQTGSNHATQSTAGYQPQLIDSGALITEGGKAAVQFDGVDDYLTAGSATFSTVDVLVASVISISEDGTTLTWFSYGGYVANAFLLQRTATDNAIRYAKQSGTGSSLLDFHSLVDADGISLVVLDDNASGNVSLTKNGSPETEAASCNLAGAQVIELGRRADSSSQYWNGTISELIIYPTDQTALRQRIEGNLAWYY